LGTCFIEVAPSTKLTADICITIEIRKLLACYFTILRNMRIVLLFCVFFVFACVEFAMEITGDEQELYQNHLLLKSYFYHPERIKPYSQYQGMEVDSMYSSLEDYLRGNRYTRYFEPEYRDIMLDHLHYSEHYYSFGFERYLKGKGDSLHNDTLIVTAVYPNSPANKAGLKKHDKLLFANNVSLTGKIDTLYEENDKLFDENTIFKVLRAEESLTLPSMKKEEVLSSTVFLDTLDDVPFISVTEFTTNTNNPRGTYQEFKDALKEIKGSKSAVIDLRGNPGGSILHCTKMAAELSPLNKQMIYDIEHYPYRNRNIIDTVRYYAKDFLKEPGDGLEIKWVVMINGRSASCAERFAAALKSTRPETVFVGQNTYGKGIGQTYITTYLGGLAGITCLQSYYPNGETFHQIGVEPDIYANPNSDEIYEKALQSAQNFESGLAKRSANSGIGTLPPKHTSRKTDLGAYKLLH
jgi:C-terminal peptidase prc